MSNIYDDPEKFGLAIVGEVEFSSGAYEFDTSVVWRDADTGDLFYADDSGCSCPIPFEGVGRNDLQKVGRPQDLIDYFETRKRDSSYYDPSDEYGNTSRIDAQVGELIVKASKR